MHKSDVCESLNSQKVDIPNHHPYQEMELLSVDFFLLPCLRFADLLESVDW